MIAGHSLGGGTLTAVSSLTVDLTGLTVGELMIASIITDHTMIVTPPHPSGDTTIWTRIVTDTIAEQLLFVWTKPYETADGTSATFTLSGINSPCRAAWDLVWWAAGNQAQTFSATQITEDSLTTAHCAGFTPLYPTKPWDSYLIVDHYAIPSDGNGTIAVTGAGTRLTSQSYPSSALGSGFDYEVWIGTGAGSSSLPNANVITTTGNVWNIQGEYVAIQTPPPPSGKWTLGNGN